MTSGTNAAQDLSGGFPPADAELVRLTAAFCDNRLTAAEGRRLAELLQDEAIRAVYRRLVWVHVNLLRLWHGGTVTLPPLPPPREFSRRWWPQSVGWLGRVAAVLLLAAGLVGAGVLIEQAGVLPRLAGWLVASPPLVPQRPARQPGSIAEITAVQQAVWAERQPPRGRYASIMPGEQLSLISGLLEIACDGGARIVLEGPVAFTLDQASVAQLDRGRATVTVAGEAAAAGQPRFTLATPTTTVTDRGTSFGVLVSDTGETAVSVLAGLVDLLPTLPAAPSLRLAAGEAAAVGPQQPPRKTAPPPGRFVRSLPPAGDSLATALAAFGWDDGRATVLFRDGFDEGAGPLAGTSPVGRGGVGETAWLAPKQGWSIDPDCGALVATVHGLATLPFQPEPGQLYRVSVTMHATAGGIGWAAVGFTDDAADPSYIPHGPWLLQRHQTAAEPNRAYAGPDQTGPVGPGDLFRGEQTRTLLLDTRQPTWRVSFFVDGRLLGEAAISPQAAAIRHVCLAAFPNSRVEFRHFSVAVLAR